ncbi:hypothetical protein ANCCAN_30536 [Ancylostoma caninum]|uniref:Uncharacterized protein n=1 Tax=Ancylostoma caninum TaxID=29170 RepID=A0A368EW11_ANCCA|nr:hypothetical protein ANCCAN_30536 [Ancylostoma caninum]
MSGDSNIHSNILHYHFHVFIDVSFQSFTYFFQNVLTVNSLTNAYSRACDVVKLPRLEGDDFAAAMQILESQSFIMEYPGGKLVLKVDADTAKSAIADSGMIAQVSGLNL